LECTIDEQFAQCGISTKHDVLLNYFDIVGNIVNFSRRDSKKTCLRGLIYKGCSERNMLYGMRHII
jgi:hypothetical protein